MSKEDFKKAKKGSFIGVSGSLELLEKQLQENETPLVIAQGFFEKKNQKPVRRVNPEK
jgi:hypothetical protein